MTRPGAQFRHGLPGYTRPPSTDWWKSNDARGRRCIATTRRVGDRQADVVAIGEAQWRVTITPVTPRYGHLWEPCGPPVELGVYGGRKAAMAAADEYLASGSPTPE